MSKGREIWNTEKNKLKGKRFASLIKKEQVEKKERSRDNELQNIHEKERECEKVKESKG